MMKKVSIVIPAYNEEACLPGCLRSIQELVFPKDNLEVILVDNGSDDRTREIAEEYGAKVLRDDEKHVSGLRNLGVRNATGEIIAFVDADCLVSKTWLQNAAVYFDAEDVSAWGSPPTIPEEATWVQKTWYLVRQKKTQIQEVDWLESMNLFVRKDQFLAVSGFNEALVTCEDVDFSYRIRQYGKIISDARIEVIHLGEAATVRHFMSKEIWRGRSNLIGLFSHRFQWKELPSLAIPLYFGVFFPGICLAALVLFDLKWLALLFVLYLLPTLAVLYKVKEKIQKIGDALRLLLLLQVYFFSRTVAVLKKNPS